MNTLKEGEKPKNDVRIRENILDIAKRLTQGDRNEDYGPPSDDMKKVAAMMTAYFGYKFDPEDVPVIMIMVKLARQSHKPKRDNLIDICGWAWVNDECIRDKEGREKTISTDDIEALENAIYSMGCPMPIVDPDSRIDPGPKYRILEIGEVIQEGDEWGVERHPVVWFKTTRAGQKVKIGPYRRRVA